MRSQGGGTAPVRGMASSVRRNRFEATWLGGLPVPLPEHDGAGQGDKTTGGSNTEQGQHRRGGRPKRGDHGTDHGRDHHTTGQQGRTKRSIKLVNQQTRMQD